MVDHCGVLLTHSRTAEKTDVSLFLQQVPQFVLCESAGEPGSSPVQFQGVSSQSQEISKAEKSQPPVTSSSTIPEGSTAGLTAQSSVVESSQNDSVDGNNEAAAAADTCPLLRGENSPAKTKCASMESAASAATTSTSTTDIKSEENNESDPASAADSQEGSAERSPDEADTPTSNSPGNEAVAKE